MQPECDILHAFYDCHGGGGGLGFGRCVRPEKRAWLAAADGVLGMDGGVSTKAAPKFTGVHRNHFEQALQCRKKMVPLGLFGGTISYVLNTRLDAMFMYSAQIQLAERPAV